MKNPYSPESPELSETTEPTESNEGGDVFAVIFVLVVGMILGAIIVKALRIDEVSEGYYYGIKQTLDNPGLSEQGTEKLQSYFDRLFEDNLISYNEHEKFRDLHGKLLAEDSKSDWFSKTQNKVLAPQASDGGDWGVDWKKIKKAILRHEMQKEALEKGASDKALPNPEEWVVIEITGTDND